MQVAHWIYRWWHRITHSPAKNTHTCGNRTNMWWWIGSWLNNTLPPTGTPLSRLLWGVIEYTRVWHTHTHTHTRACTHTHTHTHTHTLSLSFFLSLSLSHAHTRTRTHTHTHCLSRTQTQLRSEFQVKAGLSTLFFGFPVVVKGDSKRTLSIVREHIL